MATHFGPTTYSTLNPILLALRNDLVKFWATLRTLHGQAAIDASYHQYCLALDLLDPDCRRHLDNEANAVTLYRMTITALIDGVFEYQTKQTISPNQVILRGMKRRPFTLEEERQAEAMAGC
jgi:hypothetical protein